LPFREFQERILVPRLRFRQLRMTRALAEMAMAAAEVAVAHPAVQSRPLAMSAE